VPRRTWLDSKIDVFLEELAASGMHLDRQRAGELITGQVRAVAALMRVTGATARTYLGDEVIQDMARRMLFEVAGERPGADLTEAPRTVPLPLALVGITVAALAEAMLSRSKIVNRSWWRLVATKLVRVPSWAGWRGGYGGRGAGGVRECAARPPCRAAAFSA